MALKLYSVQKFLCDWCIAFVAMSIRCVLEYKERVAIEGAKKTRIEIKSRRYRI